MGRVKRGSLSYQINQRMKELDCIGEKRHIAKQDYKEYCERHDIEHKSNKTVGIYSHGSFDAIKQTMTEFTSWVKENHEGVRNIEDITREHMKQYLQERNSLSAFTTSKDMSAINKVFNQNITKEECGLKARSYKNITRSRGSNTTSSKKYNPDNYKEQIEVAKATGIRRQSMLKIKSDDFNFENGQAISLNVKEKGGKIRTVPVLKQYQGAVTNIVKSKPNGKAMFTKYTKAIDNHSFRAEYAIRYYKQLCEEKINLGQQVQENYCKNYDKELVLKVSQALGHERERVVIENYFSNSKARESVEQQ